MIASLSTVHLVSTADALVWLALAFVIGAVVGVASCALLGVWPGRISRKGLAS